MQVKINAELIKEQMVVLGKIINDVNICFYPDRMEVTGFDSSNVAAGLFKIAKEHFAEYSVENEFVVGLILSDLNKILKKAKTGEVTLTEKSGKVSVMVGENYFSLPTLEVDKEEKKFPNLKGQNKISISPAEVLDALDDLEYCKGDKDDDMGVNFIVSEKNIIFGSFQEQKESKIPKPCKVDYFLPQQKDARYSFNYMLKLVSSKLSESIELEFHYDYPLVITYPSDKYTLKFVIAPRVDND